MLALKRLYPLIACAGIMTAVAVTVAGRLGADPYPHPLNLTVSEHVALDRGGVAGCALLSVGIACLALVAGLRAAKAPVDVWAGRLMLVWGAVMIVVGIMPAVPGLS